ncbi:uncharacterized protein [Syngnathus scovelli]|uniref:uncharacterized protein isoform X1 n=1 Tax=Syngnathus scovelli TaxID=161590 RepID=UPI002110B626|nr:uncharacterized protein LOC125989252 isoform X1 [Syngnathus scovelli]XP_049611349.1 uncharacterized protein LOC125989252 isoform X1 [Syngnathus scovelli]
MADSEGTNLEDPPYKNLLLLGAIAAASAFVVTILIVLVCVGCQRKSKSKHPSAGEKGTSVNMQGTLRHPKLNSMSKSDTRLHEINRFPCNGNSVSKSRPASMDLLLLHSRRSQNDLRPSQGRQLPQIPTSPQGSSQGGEGDVGGDGGGGEARDHTYTEVALRNNPTPTHVLDDGLYETVSVREGEAGPKAPTAPPPTSTNIPTSVRACQSPPAQANGARNGNGNGGKGNGIINETMAGKSNGANGVNRSPLSSVNSLAIQEPTAAEYASIRKFRKVDKTNRKENNGADSQSDQSSVSDSPSAAVPQLQRSQEFPRKTLEPFHLHSFPKEPVFMGNGEQYIWKPPEDDDIITLHPPPPPHRIENGQGHPSPPTAKEIADTYSIVCKPQKKKTYMESNGAKTLPRSFGGDKGKGRGRGVQGQARSQEEPCYEPTGDRAWPACVAAESDTAYATIDSHRKREQASTSNSAAAGTATLKRKKQQVPSVAPQGSASNPLPVRGLPGGDNFYESISDVKGGNSSSTTTIFTFNDGMEMYVTGL